MSAGNPWWFSGDDAEPDETPPGFSGEPPEEPEVDAPQDGPQDGPTSGSGDWSALLFGAQRMVDWATERVMAPHAEHGDPRQYPQCVVCRTMVLIGEVPLTGSGAAARDDTDASVAPEPSAARPASIEWITIRGEGREP